MAEIVNLKRARKAKARAGKEATAAQNRISFGRSKAEKAKAVAERRIAENRIEAHKRET